MEKMNTTIPNNEDAQAILQPNQYSTEYFYQEMVRFRNLFTTIPYWQRPAAQRENAIKALTIVYLNLTDGADKAAVAFDAMMKEYGMREAYAILKGWISA